MTYRHDFSPGDRVVIRPGSMRPAGAGTVTDATASEIEVAYDAGGSAWVWPTFASRARKTPKTIK